MKNLTETKFRAKLLELIINHNEHLLSDKEFIGYIKETIIFYNYLTILKN